MRMPLIRQAGPTVCKSKQCDVQILKGLSGVAGNFVVQGRCSIVGRNKYVERKDHIWSCPGLLVSLLFFLMSNFTSNFEQLFFKICECRITPP